MTQINLLPWRESERKIQQIRFAVIVVAAVVLAIFLIGLVHIYFVSVIGYERDRNNYLQSELDTQQSQLGDLERGQKKEVALRDKLKFLMGLRNSNYQLVQLLNELTQLVPVTIVLTKFGADSGQITLEGKAQSDLDITHFMKNLTTSTVVTQPVLTGITASQKGDVVEKVFQLKVIERMQNA